MKSEVKRIRTMRLIRREFWMGNISWDEGLTQLKQAHDMQYDDAINFLSDSSNLDAVALLQAKLNAIPFGISLTHPSIML